MIGRCYCKHKQGNPDKNEVMCSMNDDFQRLDLCHDDEGCVGPKTADEAKYFSSTEFCLRGALKIFYYKTNSVYDFGIILFSNPLHFQILASLSCGGSTLVPHRS